MTLTLPGDDNEDNDYKDHSDAPSFGDEMNAAEFRNACSDYAEWAVEEYDEFDEVELSTVTIEISRKLKRAAGKAGKSRSVATLYFMRFAFGAYQEWGWGEDIESTIRHELVHIKQYQVDGSGGHGYDFKIMADAVDAPRHCKKFSDYKFGIFCGECDEMVGGKYRRSKKIKQAENYQSKCCGARCYSEKL